MIRRKSGFTLIEILIVVVILGILAAIVIPQFTNASETAKGSNLLSQLQTIRSQFELYQVQHGGNYPSLLIVDGSTDWEQLTGKTDLDQTKNVNGKYGPYLQQAPANPFISDDTAAVTIGVDGGAGVGWIWDSATSMIYANVETQETADKAGLTDNANVLVAGAAQGAAPAP